MPPDLRSLDFENSGLPTFEGSGSQLAEERPCRRRFPLVATYQPVRHCAAELAGAFVEGAVVAEASGLAANRSSDLRSDLCPDLSSAPACADRQAAQNAKENSAYFRVVR